MITETDTVAHALEDAARRWPCERGNRTELLRRLVAEGHRSVIATREEQVTNRRDAVARTSGALTGAYGPDYLTKLRKDWPE